MYHTNNNSIKQATYPTSTIDPLAFMSDTDRTTWHSHCTEVDVIWEVYLTEVKQVLVKTPTYNIASMAKPSGALGSILYCQWLVYVCLL